MAGGRQARVRRVSAGLRRRRAHGRSALALRGAPRRRSAISSSLRRRQQSMDTARAALAGRDRRSRRSGSRPPRMQARTKSCSPRMSALRAKRPDALLIIVPRHPERGAAVAASRNNAPRRALATADRQARRSMSPTRWANSACSMQRRPVALVAGSLLPALKGHNPIEPAKLGAPMITGPYVESFAGCVTTRLFAAEAALCARATPPRSPPPSTHCGAMRTSAQRNGRSRKPYCARWRRSADGNDRSLVRASARHASTHRAEPKAADASA